LIVDEVGAEVSASVPKLHLPVVWKDVWWAALDRAEVLAALDERRVSRELDDAAQGGERRGFS
jgi:hypothetical protein